MYVYTNLPLSSGETQLKLFLYDPQSGSLLNTGGDDLSEISNGVFVAEVEQSVLKDMRADVKLNGLEIASDWLYYGSSIVGLRLTEEERETAYFSAVRRNAADTTPIFFEWFTPDEDITVQTSLNGNSYVTAQGVASYVREEAGAYLYKISYSSEDRPETGGTISFKVSDGVNTRIIPLTLDTSGGLKGAGSVQHEVTITADGQPVDGAEVWVTTDSDGQYVVAGTLYTDAFGKATFMLDPGSYYLWVQKAGINFPNPTPMTVSE